MANFVFTGATSGLGLEAVRQLNSAHPDSHFFIGARSPETAEKLTSLVSADSIWLHRLDTSSLSSVADFGKSLLAALNGQSIQGLALNAGVQFVSDTEPSVDGFDLTFATNVLGHIALTNILLPSLPAKSVVTSTASGTHDARNKIARQSGFRGSFFPSARAVAEGEVSDASTAKQRGMDRYATSKLCNVMFTYAMARRHGHNGPRFIALDPGMMPGTELARDRSKAERVAWKTVLPKMVGMMEGASTPKRSGAVLADLLSSHAFPDGTGLHVEYSRKEIESSPLSYDEGKQDALIAFAEDVIATVV